LLPNANLQPLEGSFQLKSASNAMPHKFVIAKWVTSKTVFNDLTLQSCFQSLSGDDQEAHESCLTILATYIVESTPIDIVLKEVNLATKF